MNGGARRRADSLRAAFAEELLHERAAGILFDAADDLEAVVVTGQIAGPYRGDGRAGPRFRGTEDERTDARMHQCADAHQARLDRHDERGASQTIVTRTPRGVTNRHDLGMRRGIAGTNRLVESPSDNFTADRDDGANRDFAGITSCLGLLEGRDHEHSIVSHVGGVVRRCRENSDSESCGPHDTVRPEETVMTPASTFDRRISTLERGDGNTTAGLFVTRRGATLSDPAAQRLFVGSANETAMVRLRDRGGRDRIRMSVDREGVATLEFLDASGRVVATLPR